MNDDLGDRMKAFEAAETTRKLDASLPIYARIDGRGFSKFTAGMRKPFDARMGEAMLHTTQALVERTHAKLAYTQSDEISLVWERSSELGNAFFDGKVHKLTSVLAGLATAAFLSEVAGSRDREFAHFAKRLPHFDCRVFNLPTRQEAVDAMLWRALDARRNAVSMAASTAIPHEALQGVGVRGMLTMLEENGIRYLDYPESFRFGSFVTRGTVLRSLTDEEWQRIPATKRPPRDHRFERGEIRVRCLDLAKAANREEVLFGETEPIPFEPRSIELSDLSALA